MALLTFKLYSFVSLLLTGGAVINSYTLHSQFFPTVLYLTTQKSNVLILCNFILMIGITLLLRIISFFFGEVREIERIVQQNINRNSLLESVKKKMFDLLIVLLVFREGGFDQYFFIFVTFLNFFWVLHQLTIKRSEYLIAESVSSTNLHMKVSSMYIALFCIDSMIVRYLYSLNQDSKEKGPLFFLFFLEFVLISFNLVFPAISYFVNAFEAFTYSHFTSKNTGLMIIEFFATTAKLVTQLVIRINFHLYFPFIFELTETVTSLISTINRFFSSIKLLRQIHQLPDVYEDDLNGVDNTCLICLSEITEGKKIGCGHVFHKNCLKELIQGKSNQVCPKCRQPIIMDSKKNKENQKNKKDKSHKSSKESSSSGTDKKKKDTKQMILLSNVYPNFNKFEFNKSDLQLVQENKQTNESSNVIRNIQQVEKLSNKIKKPLVVDQIQQLINRILKLNKDSNINIDINNLFDFSQLIGKSDLQNCGAISYALPKEASYFRRNEDEILRLRIELMNMLLSNSYNNNIFENIQYGLSDCLLNNVNKENSNLEPANQEKFQLSSQKDQQQKQQEEEDVVMRQLLKQQEQSENKNEQKVDETELRRAWIESLQKEVEKAAAINNPNQSENSEPDQKKESDEQNSESIF